MPQFISLRPGEIGVVFNWNHEKFIFFTSQTFTSQKIFRAYSPIPTRVSSEYVLLLLLTVEGLFYHGEYTFPYKKIYL